MDKETRFLLASKVSENRDANGAIAAFQEAIRNAKVQRGWKSKKSQIAEGQRIHHNFVKPHMALAGKTPAEASGMSIEGKNKWKELVMKALEKGKNS